MCTCSYDLSEDRLHWQGFASFSYKTNRLHVSMSLFSSIIFCRSCRMSKCGRKISDRLGSQFSCASFCSSTSSVICSEEMHSNMQSICWIYSYHSCLNLVHAINFYWLFILSHYSSVSGKTEEGETEESLHVSYWVNNHLFI